MKNRLLFEVIAEGKVAQHLKKRVVARCVSYILQVYQQMARANNDYSERIAKTARGRGEGGDTQYEVCVCCNAPLCLPPARKQRWAVQAFENGPRFLNSRSGSTNLSLNCTIPAFVNSNVGSFAGTSEDDGTSTWPFSRKYDRKLSRIADVDEEAEEEEEEAPPEGESEDDKDDEDNPRTSTGDKPVVTDAQPCRFDELRGGCKCERRGDEVEEEQEEVMLALLVVEVEVEDNLAGHLVCLGSGPREHAQALSAMTAAEGPWRWVGRRADECRVRNMSAGAAENQQPPTNTKNTKNKRKQLSQAVNVADPGGGEVAKLQVEGRPP